MPKLVKSPRLIAKQQNSYGCLLALFNFLERLELADTRLVTAKRVSRYNLRHAQHPEKLKHIEQLTGR